MNKNQRFSASSDGQDNQVARELESLKTEMGSVEAELDSLKKELEAQKDRYLRLAADFDNFRKRTTEETGRKAAAQKETLIRELLPIVDNLERALAAGPESPDQLREGVRMTLQQLNDLLRRHGIDREESLGRPFDPHRHEAVAIRNDPSQPDHTVLETFQRGYRRGDEVFRPAKVVVNELSTSE